MLPPASFPLPSRRFPIHKWLVAALVCGPLCIGARAQTPVPEEEQTPPVAPQDAPEAAAQNDQGEPAPAAKDSKAGDATPFGIPLPGGNGAPATPPAKGAPPSQEAKMQARRAATEARMRELMTRLGIAAIPTQDAVLGFMSEDEEGRKTVREAGRKLLVGIRRDAPPERLKALLSDYQSALDSERQRRESAQTALDARVGFSLDAHLESLLWLMGVLGQGQSAFGIGALDSDSGARRVRSDASALAVANVAGAIPNEIEGTVSAKSGANEIPSWLEIRDGNGKTWRLQPDNSGAPRRILGRQIAALPLGAHLTARVAAPVAVPVLLAIIPDVPAQNTTPTEPSTIPAPAAPTPPTP